MWPIIRSMRCFDNVEFDLKSISQWLFQTGYRMTYRQKCFLISLSKVKDFRRSDQSPMVVWSLLMQSLSETTLRSQFNLISFTCLLFICVDLKVFDLFWWTLKEIWFILTSSVQVTNFKIFFLFEISFKNR